MSCLVSFPSLAWFETAPENAALPVPPASTRFKKSLLRPAPSSSSSREGVPEVEDEAGEGAAPRYLEFVSLLGRAVADP